jgi:hypothetical protein
LVFHPEHIDASRLGFNHKLQFARSIALRKNKISIWDLTRSGVAADLIPFKARVIFPGAVT